MTSSVVLGGLQVKLLEAIAEDPDEDLEPPLSTQDARSPGLPITGLTGEAGYEPPELLYTEVDERSSVGTSREPSFLSYHSSVSSLSQDYEASGQAALAGGRSSPDLLHRISRESDVGSTFRDTK